MRKLILKTRKSASGFSEFKIKFYDIAPGKSGFKSMVNCTASKALSLSLVARTALESPIFPTTKSSP